MNFYLDVISSEFSRLSRISRNPIIVLYVFITATRGLLQPKRDDSLSNSLHL